MNARVFTPTHRVVRGPESVEVMLDPDETGDGPLYTRAEYAAYCEPRWRVQAGRLTSFYGVSTECVLEGLGSTVVVPTAAVLHPPVSDRWLNSSDYPTTVWIREDGRVGVHLTGEVARLYQDVAHFCRAWRVMVTFYGPPDQSDLPEEIVARYTGEWYAVYREGFTKAFDSAHALCRHLAAHRPRSAPPWLSTDPGRSLYHWPARVDEDHATFSITDGVETQSSLWDEALRYYHALPLGVCGIPGTPVDPQQLLFPRGPVDEGILLTMGTLLQADGWTDPPLVAERRPYGGWVAWGGRHRVLAARRAGLASVPVLPVDLVKWCAAHGPVGRYGALFDTRDTVHRAQMLALSGDALPAGLMVRQVLLREEPL